ncbi:glycosyltransferase [Gammaproteobacteria bacterium]|nr:glycosyltransferase [Gammaproteobacteria bacterium]
MRHILSVLILNRNNADDVLSLYEDLKNQSFQDFHVIVIDDNSVENDLEKLLNLRDERFLVYSFPAPWQFGNDNKWNMGLRKANKTGSKYTYTIQTDMKIHSSDLLEKLVAHMERDPQCGAASPTIYNGNGEMTWGPGIEKVRMGKIYNINETFITRNKAMEEMNYVNEKLIFYGHEFYFNNWMKLHGFNTTPLSGVSITHYGGGTSTKYQNSKDYYRPRTSILIMKLFCEEDSLYKKLIYFYEENSEIRERIKTHVKQFSLVKLVRLLMIFTAGTFAGLFINVNEKKKTTRNIQ